MTHVEKRLSQGSATSYQLRQIGQDALRVAVEKLKAIAGEPPRERLERMTKALKTLRGDKGMSDAVKVTLYNTDLDAAKALARVGVETLKLSGAAAAPKKPGEGGEGQRDLFDAGMSNWDIKQPE